MNNIATSVLVTGICLLVFVPKFAFPSVHEATSGSNQSQSGHRLDDFSFAAMPTAERTPSPVTTFLANTSSLLPTVTATPASIETAVPAMAPAATPGVEVTVALTTEAVAAADSKALPFVNQTSLTETSSLTTCGITTPLSSLGLDPFYTKYCSADGIPILASAAVPDQALQRAWVIVTDMLAGMPQANALKASMTGLRTRIGIIGVQQATTDMPEHRDLYTQFPGIDWNNRARGVGATPQMPLLSIAEENLLCYTSDRWAGENILVHEFAHMVKNMGLDIVDPEFGPELQTIYQHALDAGLWTNTYVASNVEEYWAEGVRLYFQDQPVENVPGSHPYPANTRAELQAYDPDLYAIVERIFGQRGGIPLCPYTAQNSAGRPKFERPAFAASVWCYGPRGTATDA